MSAPTYQVCPCGGYDVVEAARPGAPEKREHHDANGRRTVCPNVAERGDR
nr:hypothetical protein [Streptomyces lavendulae]